MKNVNFVVPKDVQRILSSHKISEKFNEQEVFYKTLSQYSQQNTCARVYFIKKSFKNNFIILESILLKRDSNTVVFLTILPNF